MATALPDGFMDLAGSRDATVFLIKSEKGDGFYDILFHIQTIFARKILNLKGMWPRNPTVFSVLRLGVAKRRQKIDVRGDISRH